jgi:microcystin-dependent protein
MSEHITIPETDPAVTYIASSGQTAFAIPFAFFATSDVVAVVNGATQNANYTITGTAADGGYTDGTLTFSSGLADGDQVFLYRDVPVERTSDFPYPSQTLEIRALNTELDRIVAMIQDGDRAIGRTLRVPGNEPSVAELDAAEDRAGKILAFDENGSPTLISFDETGVAGPAGADGPPGKGAPIGAIAPWAGTTAPDGWLLCDGSAVSRSTYAGLYAVIGIAFGAGDGSSTFNVPDLRGRFPLGRDNMGGTAASRVTLEHSAVATTTLGAAGGSQFAQQHTHSLTDPGHIHTASTASDGAHTHTVTIATGSGASTGGTNSNTGTATAQATSSDGAHTHVVTVNANTTGATINSSGLGGSQNMPPLLVTNYIICATNVAAAPNFTDLLDTPASITANYLLGGNAAGDAIEFKQIVAGDNITITHGVGSITIASTAADALLSISSARTSDFTLALADDDVLLVGDAADIVVTVPTNAAVAWPIGRQVSIQRTGAGAVTVVGDTGVTVEAPTGTDPSARDQFSTITLVKKAEDSWLLAGDLTPSSTAPAEHEHVAADITDFNAAVDARIAANLGVGLPVPVSLDVGGTMTNGEYLGGWIAPFACSFPAGASGSRVTAGTAATGSTTISVKKNGTEFATIAWAASGTVATVTITSTTSFAINDVMTFHGPATADATLADVRGNLLGTRS